MKIGKLFGFFVLNVLFASIFGSVGARGQENYFDYNRNEPLNVREKSDSMRGAVKIIDLTYASPKGGRVSAYLVLPKTDGKSKHPAIVFHHWMMDGRDNANRTEFLDEAVELAEKTGAISLLLDAPMKREGFVPPADNPKGSADIAIVTQAVTDVRRGIDVLLARPEVDGNRMVYVGHSFGAAIGGILLGVEPRFKAFALMAGEFAVQERNRNNQTENFVKWRAKFTKEEFEDYLRRTAPLDPAFHVAKPRRTPVLLQYAKDDEFFAGEQDIVRAAKIVADPKIVKIYNDGAHELNAEARRDRAEWLAAQIGLKMGDQIEKKPQPQKTLADYVEPPVVFSVPRMNEVKIKKDLTYKKNDGAELTLDVFQSPDLKAGERRPVVLFVHGTADLANKPKDWGVFQSWGKLVAASGMTAVVFNHRIIKNKFQTDLVTAESDMLDAIEYVRKNAATLGADENEMAIVAFSGGGPLLSVVMNRNPVYVKALASFYSLLDSLDAKYSPAANLKSGLPPIFIARAGQDFPEIKTATDRFLVEALKQNASIEMMNHPAGVHGFDNQTNDARSKEIIRRFLEFLKANLNVGKGN